MAFHSWFWIRNMFWRYMHLQGQRHGARSMNQGGTGKKSKTAALEAKMIRRHKLLYMFSNLAPGLISPTSFFFNTSDPPEKGFKGSVIACPTTRWATSLSSQPLFFFAQFRVSQSLTVFLELLIMLCLRSVKTVQSVLLSSFSPQSLVAD